MGEIDRAQRNALREHRRDRRGTLVHTGAGIEMAVVAIATLLALVVWLVTR